MLEVILALLLVAICVLIHDTRALQLRVIDVEKRQMLVNHTVSKLIDVFCTAAERVREEDLK